MYVMSNFMSLQYYFKVIYYLYGIDGINDVTKNTRVKEIKKLKENWYYVILR